MPMAGRVEAATAVVPAAKSEEDVVLVMPWRHHSRVDPSEQRRGRMGGLSKGRMRGNPAEKLRLARRFPEQRHTATVADFAQSLAEGLAGLLDTLVPRGCDGLHELRDRSEDGLREF